MIDTLPEQQTLPHSTESERAVLGAILLDPECLSDVQGWLDVGELYHDRHQMLYLAMIALAARGEVPDHLTLQALLEQRGEWESCGGISYLAELDLDLPDIGRLETYCEIIRDRALRRRMIQRAGETIRSMYDGAGASVTDVAGQLMTDLDGILHRQTGDGFETISALLPGYFDLIEEPREIEGVVTGMAGLDTSFKAFERGRLLMVGGRAGVGKTAMLVQMVYREALAGAGAGIISLEMRKNSLINRLMAHGTGLHATRIWRGLLNQQEFTKVVQVSNFLTQQSLHIDDKPVQRLSEIRGKIRRLVHHHGVRSVFIDYAGLIERPGVKREHAEVQEMSDDLSRLAADLGIVIVAMVQCNRSPAKEDRAPRVSDLREAGEQAAWYVLLLHRPLQQTAESEDDGKPLLYGPLGVSILGKNRDGDEGACRTYYDGPRLQWWDRSIWESCAGQRGALLPEPIQHQLIA